MTQAKADKTEQYRAEMLSKTVEHIDITSFDARPIIDAMRKMSFTSRDLANAARCTTTCWPMRNAPSS